MQAPVAPRHRQGDSDGGAARAGADREIPGSPAAVPPGGHLWACRAGAASLDTGAVGRRLWREAAAAHLCDAGDAADPPGIARR